VRWGTHPHQRTIRSTLGAIGAEAVEAPSAIVVGEVASLDLGWFERRPLFGRRVVITRAREQASGLRARLVELGAEVVELPSIAVEPIEFELPDLAGYRWVVLTSANGVDAFLHPRAARARPRRARARRSEGRGDRAGHRRRARAFRCASPTSCPSASSPSRCSLRFRSRARRASASSSPAPSRPATCSPAGLERRGYAVDIVAVYRTITAEPDPMELARVRAGEFDAITFTSSSTVDNFFCRLVGPVAGDPVIVSIGPVTSASAAAAGLRVTVEADPHDIDGLVAAVLGVLERR